MAQLPLEQGIPRFKANEERIDTMTNGDEDATWTTSDGAEVPSIRKLFKEINTEGEGWLALAEDAAAEAALYGPLTFDSVTDFFASVKPNGSMIGKRVWSQDGLAWDIVPKDTGDLNHPVTSVGLMVVPVRGEYYFEAWGAGAGVLPEVNNELMQAAIDKVSDLGGGTLKMFPGSGPWNFGANDAQNLLIRASNVHIDCQFSFITANARFNFRGNVAEVDGALDADDESHLLHNVSFRNAFFGDPEDFDTISRGPIFEWVADPVIENCHRAGRGGTCFNMHFARRPMVRNISVYGAREIGLGDTIGFLALHTHDGVYEDIKIGGPGQFVYCVQQKGGSGNKWVRTHVHDITYAHSSGVLLRDRGDNPYDASPTTGPYPYSGGSWATPDLRRASIGTEWIDCSGENGPQSMPLFRIGEAKDCRIRGLRGKNCRGFHVIKDALAPSGYSDGHEIIDTRLDNVVLPVYASAASTEPMSSLKIRGLSIRGIGSQTLTASQYGIYLENTSGALIENFDLDGGDGVAASAIRLVNSPNAIFRNGKVSGKYTGVPVTYDTMADRPVFDDVDFSGAVESGLIFSAFKGLTSRKTLASKYRTTDATLQNVTRAGLPNDTTAYLEAEIIGKSATGYMLLRLGRWYQTTGSTMTALGASADTIMSQKVGTASSVPWSGGLNMVSDLVRIQFQGAASETIDWTVSYTWRGL